MADYCLCEGNNCPLKLTSLRYLTDPQILNVYFTEIPYDGNNCKFYMEIDDCRKISKTSKESRESELSSISGDSFTEKSRANQKGRKNFRGFD